MGSLIITLSKLGFQNTACEERTLGTSSASVGMYAFGIIARVLRNKRRRENIMDTPIKACLLLFLASSPRDFQPRQRHTIKKYVPTVITISLIFEARSDF